MKCRECDYDYQGNPKFCPECGKPTTNNDDRERDNDDDNGGGIFGAIGDIVGKIFG